MENKNTQIASVQLPSSVELPANRSKIIFFIISMLFVLAVVVGVAYLVKKRQDIGGEAAIEQRLTCKGWSGGNYSDYGKDAQGNNNWFNGLEPTENGIKKIQFYGNVSDRIGWEQYKYCDYLEYVKNRNNIDHYYCRDGDPGYYNTRSYSIHNVSEDDPQYTKELGEIIDQSHYGGTCQIIQVDVSPCEGGTAHVIHVNPNCPTPTPTPTPALTSTPTPTPALTSTPTPTPALTPTPTPTPVLTPIPGTCQCSNLKLYSDNAGQNEITPDEYSQLRGATAYIGVSGDVNDLGDYQFNKARIRINGGSWQETMQKFFGRDEFYITYVFPETGGNFSIEGEIHLNASIADPQGKDWWR